MSRRKVAQAAALSLGRFTLTVPRAYGISRQIMAGVISDRDADDGNA